MSVKIITGDCLQALRSLPECFRVNTCVTSPPYFGLRDYGVDGQMGLESTPEEYVAGMVAVFREVRRVLRDDGTLWLNIGDSYCSGGAGVQGICGQMASRRVAQVRDRKAVHGDVLRPPSVFGLKQKDLIGIPWMLAFALRADGWYLRQDIIWSKPNPMPESVTDRCTKAHEYLFLMSKSARYYYDAAAISEPGEFCGQQLGIVRGQKVRAEAMGRAPSGNEVPGADATAPDRRNKRSVWSVATQPFSEAHFATFPPSLIQPCVLAGCPVGGTVLDPFGGAGTTGLVADRLQRNALLIELNPAYAQMARDRLSRDAGMFAEID